MSNLGPTSAMPHEACAEEIAEAGAWLVYDRRITADAA